MGGGIASLGRDDLREDVDAMRRVEEEEFHPRSSSEAPRTLQPNVLHEVVVPTLCQLS